MARPGVWSYPVTKRMTFDKNRIRELDTWTWNLTELR